MSVTQFSTSQVSTGLVTTTVVVPTAGPLSIKCKIDLPQISKGTSPSACVCTINQNGTPVYTGTAGASGAETQVTTAANDSITVVLSSAAAVDQPVNAIKAVISMSTGE